MFFRKCCPLNSAFFMLWLMLYTLAKNQKSANVYFTEFDFSEFEFSKEWFHSKFSKLQQIILFSRP